MSQENVELYRRINDLTKGAEAEAARIAEGTSLFAPDFYVENVPMALTDKTYRGPTAGIEWWTDISDGFAEGARFEVDEVIADGPDFVVGRVVLRGTGLRSEAPLELRWYSVQWDRDGKAIRGAGYATRREALKAVGLEG